jgi:tetrahydromethanopterin S-methyltransferase subunit B
MSRLTPVTFALALALALPGCEAIAGIFRAGFWVGIVIAALVIAVIVAIARRAR